VTALPQNANSVRQSMKGNTVVKALSMRGRQLHLLKWKLFTFMYMSTDNINLELKDVQLEGSDWIYVAQDRDQLLAFMNVKM